MERSRALAMLVLQRRKILKSTWILWFMDAIHYRSEEVLRKGLAAVQALLTITTRKGFFKRADCFNLSGQETPRWIKQVEPDPEMNLIADFLTPEVLDIKRDRWIDFVLLDFILCGWDRVPSPGGLLWIDSLFCLKEDLDDYLEAFKMPRNGKHRRIAFPKLNKNGRQVFFPAVPEKPPRPIRYQNMPKPIFLLVSDSGSPISLASTLSPC
ncbi:hypothetical protein POTOM_048062 [Populus tomentosa]|uniref:Uncharacterized protein n=1 Tax=Populus tomentosa TaxID=118781 RepID=A0A8X8C4A6_POPTO|nr:hypothetical protein POTOM_048062 [Populus tomentosa]